MSIPDWSACSLRKKREKDNAGTLKGRTEWGQGLSGCCPNHTMTYEILCYPFVSLRASASSG